MITFVGGSDQIREQHNEVFEIMKTLIIEKSIKLKENVFDVS